MILDDVVGIINKFVPDKNKQEEVKIELEKLEIEKIKAKGSILDKMTKHERLVIPSFLLVLLCMYALSFLSDFTFSILGKEAPIYHFEGLESFCKLLVSLIFGKKTIQKFSK